MFSLYIAADTQLVLTRVVEYEWGVFETPHTSPRCVELRDTKLGCVGLGRLRWRLFGLFLQPSPDMGTYVS